jgi:glyoxylase-like metal-dependent hydrolase (beta-lactamase superfamily II)
MRVERVLCPNPGPYTGPGTNTYVIADDGVALILDPGPIIDIHLDAIRHALGSDSPMAVAVTHTHPDHAPAANPLGDEFGVPVYGFAPGLAFEPTETIADGDVVTVGSADLKVLHTPGHTDDHICYLGDDVLFTGDHIISGSTVILEDATAYMQSLELVERVTPDLILPGHGDRIPDGRLAVQAYIAHRRMREDQFVAAIADGAATVGDIVDAVYEGLASSLVPAAMHQVGVVLLKLAKDGRIAAWDGDVLAATRLSVGTERA